MNAFHAIVLGIVQGLTEFLPVSSTGHLRIVPALLGWGDPGTAFTAVCQLGTMAAVLIYFREDLLRLAKATLGSLTGDRWHSTDVDARTGWYIILGTIPISILGLVFHHVINHGARGLYVIGTALIVFSFVILRAEAAGTQERELSEINQRDGLMIGLAQAIALIPGVSRSGATISAGLMRGFNRTDAARYSFLLSVPAVVLSGLFELKDVGNGGGASAGATAIATLLAFIVGYASIAFLLRFLTHNSLAKFCGYRIAVGALVIALAAAGSIS